MFFDKFELLATITENCISSFIYLRCQHLILRIFLNWQFFSSSHIFVLHLRDQAPQHIK